MDVRIQRILSFKFKKSREKSSKNPLNPYIHPILNRHSKIEKTLSPSLSDKCRLHFDDIIG
jgi:hypothetical protein